MSRLYSLDFDGGRIGLAATGGSPSVGRVYLGSQDALRVIADENTAIPGGTGKFEDFPDLQAVAFDAAHDRVAFLGGADVGGVAIQQLGVYEAAAGALRLIVNQETVVPGKAQKFGSGLCGVAYDDGVLGFSSGLHGVYRVAGNELVAVVKRSTPIPGGTGTFGHFGCRLAMDDGAIAFEGDNNAAPRQAGIFLRKAARPPRSSPRAIRSTARQLSTRSSTMTSRSKASRSFSA